MPRITDQDLNQLFDSQFERAKKCESKQLYSEATFYWLQCVRIRPNSISVL